MVPVSAIVLAAGASRRLGHPKALVDLGGSSALERILRALRDGAVTRGVIVVGEHGAQLRAAFDPAPLVWVDNPAPDAGRTGSVQCGLTATDPADDVLLWPVDRPFATAEVVAALRAARAADPSPSTGWYAPVASGRRGHPVLVRAELRAAILAAAPDASLREVLHGSGRARLDVPAGDASLHFDLDTEEDLRKARAWIRERARPAD